MNLIEQLGGYEKAKEVLINSSIYTHIDIYDGINYFLYEKQSENMSLDDVVTFNPRTKGIGSAHVSGGLHKFGGWHVPILDIEKALIKYRRQHNIFEIGDKIVSTLNGDEFWMTVVCTIDAFHKKMAITDGAGHTIHHYEFRHATDLEIAAGHRL